MTSGLVFYSTGFGENPLDSPLLLSNECCPVVFLSVCDASHLLPFSPLFYVNFVWIME